MVSTRRSSRQVKQHCDSSEAPIPQPSLPPMPTNSSAANADVRANEQTPVKVAPDPPKEYWTLHETSASKSASKPIGSMALSFPRSPCTMTTRPLPRHTQPPTMTLPPMSTSRPMQQKSDIVMMMLKPKPKCGKSMDGTPLGENVEPSAASLRERPSESHCRKRARCAKSPEQLSSPIMPARCAKSPDQLSSPTMPKWITVNSPVMEFVKKRTANKKPTLLLSECALSIFFGRPFVYNIAITPACIESLFNLPMPNDYELSSRFSSGLVMHPNNKLITSVERDINDIVHYTTSCSHKGVAKELLEFEPGSMEWFGIFGRLISLLLQFHELTLIQLDCECSVYGDFWENIAESNHLYKLKMNSMDLSQFCKGAALFEAPSLRCIIFEKCNIPSDIGAIIANNRTLEPDNMNLTTIAFIDCWFEDLERDFQLESFANDIASVKSLVNFHFDYCTRQRVGLTSEKLFVDYIKNAVSERENTNFSTDPDEFDEG